MASSFSVDSSEMVKPSSMREVLKQYLMRCYQTGVHDPTFFDESDVRYKAVCGRVHVKTVVICLAVMKLLVTFMVSAFLIIHTQSLLIAIAALFIICTLILTLSTLAAGVRTKKCFLLLPYFSICVIFLFVFIMQLFVSLLETAGAKTIREEKNMLHHAVLLLFVVLEAYTLSVVWRTFVYVCDLGMQHRLEQRGLKVPEEVEAILVLQRKQSRKERLLEYDDFSSLSSVESLQTHRSYAHCRTDRISGTDVSTIPKSVIIC